MKVLFRIVLRLLVDPREIKLRVARMMDRVQICQRTDAIFCDWLRWMDDPHHCLYLQWNKLLIASKVPVAREISISDPTIAEATYYKSNVSRMYIIIC